MKILFIVTQSEFGGAQRYIYEVASHLDAQKYEFVVSFGEGDDGLNSKFKIQNSKLQFKIKNLKHLKRVPGPISALLSVIEIFNLLKKERPDVLFLCSTTAGILGSIASFLYKKMFHVPCSMFHVIYRIGGWAFRDPRPKWQNKIILWLEKLTSRFKDKIIVNSEIDRQLALKYKIAPEEKLVKIDNGIDVNKLEFLPKEEAVTYLKSKVKSQKSKVQVKSQKLIIGTIANFYKTKGLEYLIEAVRILNSGFRFQVSGFKLIIIGDGRLRPQLEALIKKYNLEHTVFLLGRLPDAYQYLKALDIFVLPSAKEGFPWVILEAMAAEVPVIATKVGALPEIIEDGREGLLVEPKNSQVLAEKIAWLLNSPQKAQEMALLARKKMENHFTLQKMLTQTQKLFNRLPTGQVG